MHHHAGLPPGTVSRRRAVLVALVALAVGIGLGLMAPRVVSEVVGDERTPAAEAPSPTPTGVAEPGSDPDTVFAHYFPPYPISIDNLPPDEDYYARGYLSVDGEGGKHQAYGGLLRDRPLGRAPRPGDWKVADMLTEIQQAREAGIDGFTLDLLALSGRTWDIAMDLMTAADLDGDFQIVPMLDTSSVDATPPEVADAVSVLLERPSAHRIDGEPVLASFLAEARSVGWWREVLTLLEGQVGAPVKFIAVFNSPTESTMAAYAAISYGLGSWGYRTAQAAAAAPDLAARAHALGMRWMQAVAVQDARPRSGTFAEASNTETLRTTWMRAIDDGADFVQIATWNDYSESTAIAPSERHGRVFLDLCAYYAAWFSEGVPPRITTDRIFLTHRTQPWAAPTTSGIATMQPTLGGTAVPPRDTVEALVFLTEPAVVTLTSGQHTTTVELPAGQSAVLVALDPGRPSAQIRRGSEIVASVVSPYEVVSTPFVQDLAYVAASS